MTNKIIIGIITLFLTTTFFSCKEDTFEQLRKNELEKLRNYVETNYPDEQQLPSGLYFLPISEGSGDTIKVGDRVQIFYATWTIDGNLVDETDGYTNGHRYDPYEFVVGNGDAIQGLEEAMTYMRKGGKADLIIPSEIAYGQSGNSRVPGFTTLLMQVEVYKIFPAPVQGAQ